MTYVVNLRNSSDFNNPSCGYGTSFYLLRFSDLNAQYIEIATTMFSQALLLLSLVLSLTRAAGKPNIVLILTDDQDQQLGSVEHMPTVQDQLIRLGTKYERHYCQNALCCPSRASLLTGMRPHNTNVTDLAMPHGTFPYSDMFSFAEICRWLREVRGPRS